MAVTKGEHILAQKALDHALVLVKKLAVAVKALEYYESCDGVGEQDNGVMAREALKELQEGK